MSNLRHRQKNRPTVRPKHHPAIPLPRRAVKTEPAFHDTGKGIDMLATLLHARSMSMIQIRNVPENVHRDLKARAARAGMTLSDYLLDVISKATERPEPDLLLKRVRERTPVYLSESPADALRAEREAR